MAYTSTPADLFASMSYGASAITIPVAALAEHGLVAADCDPTTGDARKIAYALLGRIEEWYADLAAAARPKAITALPALSIGLSSGDFPDAEVTKVTFTTYRARPAGTVQDEP